MLTSSHAGIDAVLDDVAKEGCASLLDEVFMDLEVKFYFSKFSFLIKKCFGGVLVLF